MQATSLRFAAAARTLGQAARLRGLVVPCFRSPPSLAGVHRSIRCRRGVPTIAVRLRGRPWAAVVSDMIEGIVVGNALSGSRADRIRAALWLAVDNSTAQPTVVDNSTAQHSTAQHSTAQHSTAQYPTAQYPTAQPSEETTAETQSQSGEHRHLLAM